MRFAPLLLWPALLAAQTQPVVPDRDKSALEGQVLNAATVLPVPKVRLTIRMNVAAAQTTRQPQGPPQPSSVTVTSGADGKFEFINLDPGDYQLTARRDGFANATLGIRDGSKKADPIVLTAGGRKSGVTLKLIPFGAVAGRIADEDGDPIQGLEVAAMTYQYTTRGRELVETRKATTDDLGEYRIFDLPAGKYVLKAGSPQRRMAGSAEESDSFLTTYYPNTQNPASAAATELTAGQQLRGLNLTLRKARFATIRGRVIAPPGAAISVGLVTRSENGTSSSSHGVQDKDGKFELFGVTPGQVNILGTYTLYGQKFNAELPLQVGSTDIGGIELRPLPTMLVTGQVRIDGQTTVKPSDVRITLRSGGHSSEASPEENGGLTFRELEASPHRVETSRLQSLYVKSIQWGTADVTDGEIDLTNGIPLRTELTVVLGADSGQIEGTVKNDRSEPADAVMVTLVPSGARRYRAYYKTATTDATGHFLIRGVAPGSYKIFAWDTVNPNAVMYDPDFLRPYEGSSQLVEVESNDKKKLEVKLTLNQQSQ